MDRKPNKGEWDLMWVAVHEIGHSIGKTSLYMVITSPFMGIPSMGNDGKFSQQILLKTYTVILNFDGLFETSFDHI